MLDPLEDEAVRAEAVTKVYGTDGNEVHALRGVDCTIRRGECVAIMGPSGSGKSTLLYLLGGVDEPTSGRIWLEGTDLTAIGEDKRTLLRRRRLGFIFQAFNLLPNLTVVDNVTLPLLLDGVTAADANRRAEEVLALVKMSHRSTHRPSELSGGEQQRVAIARALVINPAMLLADEPTGNLDTANSDQVIRLLRSVTNEGNRAVVLVTHDPHIAAQADRVLAVIDGQVRYNGQPSQQVLWSLFEGQPA